MYRATAPMFAARCRQVGDRELHSHIGGTSIDPDGLIGEKAWVRHLLLTIE